jgi:hypothetical protein
VIVVIPRVSLHESPTTAKLCIGHSPFYSLAVFIANILLACYVSKGPELRLPLPSGAAANVPSHVRAVDRLN